MIGKAKWFTRRKYTGWGIIPTSWQGVVYILVAVGIFYLIQVLPVAGSVKIFLTAVFAIFFVSDPLLVMASIKLDEREAKIEAVAERNASWTMVAALAIMAFYFSVFPRSLDPKQMLFVLIIPIVAGVIVKALSNIILDRWGV